MKGLFPLYIGFIVGFVFTVTLGLVFDEHTREYRQGQIDCQTGKMVWQLTKQQDGSVVWTKVK
jgi:uncharacterized membrane protein YjjB (DUF3815 family)